MYKYIKLSIVFFLFGISTGCATLEEAFWIAMQPLPQEEPMYQTEKVSSAVSVNSIYPKDLKNIAFYQQNDRTRLYVPINKQKFAFFVDILKFFTSNYYELEVENNLLVYFDYYNAAIEEVYVSSNNNLVVTIHEGEDWETIEPNIHGIIKSYKFYLSSGVNENPVVADKQYDKVDCIYCNQFRTVTVK